jgi:hypothetical protein
MFDWFWKNAKVEVIVADLAAAQATITKLSGGILTLQSEIILLRQILSANGIVVPVGQKQLTAEDLK